MGGCMCFGRMLPKPASKFPVKRYNILVPDIFPIKPPQVDEDLPSFTIKKIEKLEEYVTKNPQRASKVSRRLDRRIKKEISRRAPNSGYVKIAVHAYAYLLARDNVNFYALELIKRQDCVIRTLLEHRSIHLRILGAELLAHFVRQQNDSDNLVAVESFVPILARNCREELPVELNDAEEQKKIELKVACLRGLREHIGLIQKVSEAPRHLDLILASVLDNLDCKVQTRISETTRIEASISQRPSSPVQRLRNLSARRNLEHTKSTSMDFNFLGTLNIPDELALASTPSNVASEVMSALGSLTRAAGNAEAVLQCLLQQLDERKDWSGGEVVRTVFDMMHFAFSREHQQFLLFTVVMRHAAFANHLPLSERTCLIQLAINEGLLQDIHLSVSVLVHCLAHLPLQLPPPVQRQDGLIRTAPEIQVRTEIPNSFFPEAQKLGRERLRSVGRDPLGDSPKKVGDPKEDALRCVILQGIGKIAERVEGAMQLMDTLLGVLTRFNHPMVEEEVAKEEEIAVLECVLAAAEAAAGFPEETARLPTRKYEQAMQELVALLCNLSTPQSKVLVYRLIRLTLPLAPSPNHPLLHIHVVNFLSAVYHGVASAENQPEIFAEMAATFGAVMERSPTKSRISAVQLMHTLWGEASNHLGNSRLVGLDSTQRCAVLLLCRSMIGSLSSTMRFEIDSKAWAAADLEQILQPSLKLDGHVLLGGTAAFPMSMEDHCSSFLSSVSAPRDSVKTALVEALRGHEPTLAEFPHGVVDLIGSDFTPESLGILQAVSQTSLNSTPDSSLATSDAESGQDWSKRVMKFWRSSSSWKREHGSQILIDSQDFLRTGGSAAAEKEPSKLTLGDVLKIVDESGVGETEEEGLDFNELVLDMDPMGSP
ncbi:hypothetical protein BSKO_05196 [Bryopsis sp. KO-2023]|nr:hypothetical protein BSKO_05196 [Bryopsis sp. KO-2023]